ncbi:MAG: hypothetical protein ACRENK_09725 [Gemmatimonadaceae bacterium]
MTPTRKIPRDRLEDVEKPRPLVADAVGDRLPTEPLTVRVSDIWSDFLRAADESEEAARKRSASAVPLLDDMKGILQWD